MDCDRADHGNGIAVWLAAHAQALNLAARDTIQLVAVCAVAGIIVGVVALTGIGGRFSELILGIAGANQLLAMLFVALVALVLGMGMPTTAAYAIAAAVLAPGLTKIGVPVLVAHMFIFYFAVISAITPPVALASFAAAGMAQADPWKTSWMALKMGLATFIVPFMFYFSPILLWKGRWPTSCRRRSQVASACGCWRARPKAGSADASQCRCACCCSAARCA